jgi:hypothetical protein
MSQNFCKTFEANKLIAMRRLILSHRKNGWFDLARAAEEGLHAWLNGYPCSFRGLPLPHPPGTSY